LPSCSRGTSRSSERHRREINDPYTFFGGTRRNRETRHPRGVVHRDRHRSAWLRPPGLERWTARWVTSVSEVTCTQPTNADAIRSRPLRGARSTVRYHRRSLVNRRLRLSIVRTGSIRGSDPGPLSSEGGTRFDLGYRHVETMEKTTRFSTVPRDRHWVVATVVHSVSNSQQPRVRRPFGDRRLSSPRPSGRNGPSPTCPPGRDRPGPTVPSRVQEPDWQRPLGCGGPSTDHPPGCDWFGHCPSGRRKREPGLL
jgi:hypothetical protein